AAVGLVSIQASHSTPSAISHQRRRIGLRAGAAGRGAALGRMGGGAGGFGGGGGGGTALAATGGVGGAATKGSGRFSSTGAGGGGATACTADCAVPHHGQKSTRRGKARPQPAFTQRWLDW